ncbi:MAG: tRNA (adenosine(37)-N6)-threonylcarbamoyltransferase complex transferase subunit TsaD [Melioribacteraceae bacterium]|nr:MAG: tRNA (adenosine(37)-N6)-threonylcarbamoyltransferase complex transferase subunit TsaD [Melioribacteraceae bacterium]
MNVLGIETSCDETSVAIISNGRLKANLISSQDFHKFYGGVVPELSSRAHLQMVNPLLRNALSESKLSLKDIDLVCATAGPGLIGALLVGLTFAKGLSLSLGKPFIPVNHIEGHIFSGFLMNEKPEFPYLCLVVSGGHTLLLIVKNELEIIKLGSTIDDAAGEAFDKVAKMLGLGYPGGPALQKAASLGNEDAIDFPIAQLKTEFDYSFSGLKTAVLRYLQKEHNNNLENISNEELNNIAASFQKAAVEALVRNVKKAISQFELKAISLVGGVAANMKLRNSLEITAKKSNLKFVVPDIQYCGDNAAMIAYRGFTLHKNGKSFDLNANAYPSILDGTFIEYQPHR